MPHAFFQLISLGVIRLAIHSALFCVLRFLMKKGLEKCTWCATVVPPNYAAYMLEISPPKTQLFCFMPLKTADDAERIASILIN